MFIFMVTKVMSIDQSIRHPPHGVFEGRQDSCFPTVLPSRAFSGAQGQWRNQ
jgi:hypothetical protein